MLRVAKGIGLGVLAVSAGLIASALALQGDKLVVAGVASGDGNHAAVMRFDADGSLDPTFSGDGRGLYTTLGDSVTSVQVLPSDGGDLLLTGNRYDAAGIKRQYLARLHPDGSLDASFGQGGVIYTDHAVLGEASVTPEGALLVPVGAPDERNDAEVLGIARYAADGTLDTAFGSGGIASLTVGDWHLGPRSVLALRDGSLVAVGLAYDGSRDRRSITDYAAVFRFEADGTPATGFGDGGLRYYDADYWVGYATRAAEQADGKLVVAGPSFISRVLVAPE